MKSTLGKVAMKFTYIWIQHGQKMKFTLRKLPSWQHMQKQIWRKNVSVDALKNFKNGENI